MTECLDHGLKGNGLGYARWWCRERHKKMLAHRLVFERVNGYLPTVVMHTCDNARCVEPTHLVAGDWDLNNKDRAAKGRSAQTRYDKRTLPDWVVHEIRRRFPLRTKKDPVNGPLALSREFGVDTNVIYQVASGRTYRDV